MANTNTNTDIDVTLSSDIYEVADFIDSIRRNNVSDVDESASMVGMFGYMTEAFSQSLQNALIVASENSNEAIATKAKFSKNVIAHALNLGIRNILATPATMTLLIYLPTEFIENNFTEYDPISGRGKFVLDNRIPINVGDFEFHLDYDVIINRIKNPSGEYVYTAMYDLFESGTTIVKQQNPISNISNPYINAIAKYVVDGVEYVAFSAKLHQVTLTTIEKNILTDNSIENKALTFEFGEQLASFDVDVIENGVTTHLTPIYSGLLDYTVTEKWCYYTYINENTMRIIFDKESYVPGMNAVVKINIKTCEGANGIFTYNENFKTALQSEEYNNYNGMYALIYPLMGGSSVGGKDKKSISDLQKIIPREASSRGAIINTTDLQNYFNSINDDNCKMYFFKKRDNPFERLYYSYMLMRKDSIVYPTNTLDLFVTQDQFEGHAGNNNLSINPGTIFYFYRDNNSTIATITAPDYEDVEDENINYNMTKNSNGDLVRVFEYMSPFLITIDDDLITSYLLTIMNENKTFKFVSINTDSNLQFVATNMDWQRKFICDDGSIYSKEYTMDMTVIQNTNMNYELVKYHTNANGDMVFDDIRVKVIMVLYADETDTNPYRYLEAELVEYDDKSYVYDFRFTLGTDDIMDLNNRINITGIYNAKPEELQTLEQAKVCHGYMNKNTYAKIFILADFGIKAGDVVDGITKESDEVILYGSDGIGNRTEIEFIIPTRNDVVKALLNNDIYVEKDGENISIVSIIKANQDYLNIVKQYNNNELETETMILRYLRNNIDSDFVQNILLKDESVLEVINSYSFKDLSRYTVCNVLSVDDGIDFYHDYSSMMTSTVNVAQVQEDYLLEIPREDSLGNPYTEYKPVYKTDENGDYVYNYTIRRIPMIKNGFLNTESSIQDFIYELEQRRKYIEECLTVLEDTFGMDFKFFNTYGPSNRFYYDIPSATSYKVQIPLKSVNVYSSTVDEDNTSAIVGVLEFGDEVMITKVKGQWGYIETPFEGWIKLSNCTKVINYIDNVSLNMKFALEAQTSADKVIGNSIIYDIKEYMEDINEITELHIPNIITLITNSYREQLVYFEFLNVNNYGAACQHLYLDESISMDLPPEFLNIESSEDGTLTPKIDITVY